MATRSRTVRISTPCSAIWCWWIRRDTSGGSHAIQVLTKVVSQSDLDSAAMLFRPETMVTVPRLRAE